MSALIIEDFPSERLEGLLAAIAASAPGARVRLLTETAVPVSSPKASEGSEGLDQDLVRQVADVLLAYLNASQFPGSVEEILCGGTDSLAISNGTPALSPRAVMIGIAKALRAGLPWSLFLGLHSPVDLLVRRDRVYFPDGAYKGIRYTRTPLGTAVCQLVWPSRFETGRKAA
jgi:hypothetical protein